MAQMLIWWGLMEGIAPSVVAGKTRRRRGDTHDRKASRFMVPVTRFREEITNNEAACWRGIAPPSAFGNPNKLIDDLKGGH
jgi:hypothetical protein